jgi:hypothetical protein
VGRKAKVKIKRGKVKFKLKSGDALLLHPHDGITPLLGAAMASVLTTPAVQSGNTALVTSADRRSLQQAPPREISAGDDR